MNEFRLSQSRMNIFEKFFFWSLSIFGVFLPIMSIILFFMYNFDINYIIIGFPTGAISFGLAMAMGSSKLNRKKVRR